MAAGAHVVAEPGKGERRRAGPPSDLVAAFEDENGGTAARQLDGRGKPVGTGADDDGVVHALAVVPGRAPGEVIEMSVTFLEETALGVEDAPVQGRTQQWLGLDHDRAHLAVLEVALLLDTRQQALVTQMAFAEIPGEDGAGDVLAVDVAVFLEGPPAQRLRQQETEAPPLQVQRAERHATRVHARSFRRGKAFQLLAQKGRGALHTVELAV